MTDATDSHDRAESRRRDLMTVEDRRGSSLLFLRGRVGVAALAAALIPALAFGASGPLPVGMDGSTAAHAAELEFTRAPNPEARTNGWGHVGEPIDLILGDWEPKPDRVEIRWLRDGVVIPGAAADTYTPVAADENHSVRVRVTAIKAGYVPTTRDSDALHITQGVWEKLADPEIRGVVLAGEILTALPGTWNPVPETIRYVWRYPDAHPDRALAVGQSYRLPEAVAGKQIVADIIVTKPGYGDFTFTTDPMTVPELLNFTTTPAPTLSGQTRVGVPVRAVPGDWAPTPSAYAYQWLRDGVPIPKAVGSSYTPVVADLAKRLSVRVVGTRPGYRGTERASSESTVLAGASTVRRLSATPKPRISGTVRVGKKLSVRAGSWKPARVSLSYRWLRNGKAIRGATKSKYRLTSKDRGKRISVRVTGKKSGYVTAVRTSSSKRVARSR